MGLRSHLFFLCILGGNILANPQIKWLESQSMLHQSKLLAKEFSGKQKQWERSYASPKPLAAISVAENWFTSYPSAIITKEEESVLAFLGKKELWSNLEKIGLTALHTGPMQIAGSLKKQERKDSVDGGFDRISFHLDPEYGSYTEYLHMVETAEAFGGSIIGDLVPAHSGLGADFQLALAGYRDYPGVFHMIEIPAKDWKYLPDVPTGLSKNLTPKEVDMLKEKGYIVGRLETTIFFHPNTKKTNWDVTRKIQGADGKTRRWVYLHYFKKGQPSYNWLDPSFGAQRIVAGDALFCMFVLKNVLLRLDANAFLGVENVENTKKAWSEAHPVAIDATNTVSMLIRKFGGYSFQELNLGPKSIKEFSRMGADLSYDFLTRAAYVNALLHGNTDLLKISYELMHVYGIDPRIFIHAMQNHDELNYELKHLKECSQKQLYYHGKYFLGKDLRKKIQEEDLAMCGKTPFYNRVSGEGLCSTMVGICAACLKIPDVFAMTKEEKERLQKAHLLLAFFNAMQPGVFAISAWDLVGALPLREKEFAKWKEKDQDERWCLRGAVDLLHQSEKYCAKTELPKAESLYCPLPVQLKNPQSFASKLREILLARKCAHIAKALWLGYLPTKHPGLFVLLNRLPSTGCLQISACNFSEETVQEELEIIGIKETSAINLLTRKMEKKEFHEERLKLELGPLEAKAIVFEKAPEKP